MLFPFGWFLMFSDADDTYLLCREARGTAAPLDHRDFALFDPARRRPRGYPLWSGGDISS
ncbi:MAG: hypothetical protein CME46_06425 [Halieaceae bacterium]|nr:hypothetical protein [Halieaceae bacterium]